MGGSEECTLIWKSQFIIKILFISWIFCLFPFQLFAGVVIIGNRNSTPDELSRVEIKSIFLGKIKNWDNKTPIKLAICLKNITFEEFTEQYTKKSRTMFRAYWRRLVFIGESKAPKGFKTDSEVINYVSLTNGAMGFVSSDIKIKNVKIITITNGVNIKDSSKDNKL